MISEFRSNNCIEYFVTVELPPAGHSFSKIADSIFNHFDNMCQERRLDNKSLIYIKIYLSDISNQADYICKYLEEKYQDVFYILIGQAPASGAKIAIEAYFCKAENNYKIKKDNSLNKVALSHGQYLTVFGNMTTDLEKDSYEQTEELMNNLSCQLSELGGNIKQNTLRTWFYIRDIDNNYQGMVRSRRELFEKENMTKDTHFISSTGIGGCSPLPFSLVQLSYILTFGLEKEQVEFMSAPENMNPTHEYGVTFERGTKVTYGDRSHYYISGTASIDNKGNIVFLNDVIRQTERALTNIEALLGGYNAGIDDLKIMIVYLRDFSDYHVVNEYLNERFRDRIPYIIVNAPVCRPGWLVEIEGIAVNDHKNCMFKDFI